MLALSKRCRLFLTSLLLLSIYLPCSGLYARDGRYESEIDFENSEFLIGTGIHDITGPIAEVGMMGYGLIEQIAHGLHIRLRSRAFAVVGKNGKRIVFVSADLGQLFQGVKQGVVKKIKASPELAPLYGDDNIIISATHTHSGPGGYSHYFMYNLMTLGFNRQNFEAITDGIYKSILKAHKNLEPGSIRMVKGELDDAGWNRSYLAYEANPIEEREKYSSSTDKTMTLLRFDNADGSAAGVLNWFAVHPTSLGNTNDLISGDSKGVASYNFEKKMNTNYKKERTFIAAFAQSNSGDVSPNIFWGYPDEEHDFERMEIIAKRQLNKAEILYDEAKENLSGSISYGQSYVDMHNLKVDSKWIHDDSENVSTCAASIGFPMIAGSTEDGRGVSFSHEGISWSSTGWFSKEESSYSKDNCHGEKIVLLPMTSMKPYPWTPEVMPIQIATIGSLAIIAIPFEISTMASRRLKNTVLGQLKSNGITDAVIAGLANAYSGYVTTSEEYAIQHYEGASTHFGPYTLNAYQQEYARVAKAISSGEEPVNKATPRDLSGSQIITHDGASVILDTTPLGKSFGDVEENPSKIYSRGQNVKCVFWGAHPKNNLRTQGTFLAIERKEGNKWKVVARDWDPETTYRWERSGVANSKVTISWKIPSDAESGEYRIKHFGDSKSIIKRVSSYKGVSRVFTVK